MLGIVIIAVGKPFYGRLAFNLAASIKAVSKIPICIVHDRTALGHITNYDYFDHLVEIECEPNCGAKLLAYEHSPFEKTLLLDADMLWLPYKTPDELFEKLKGIPFTAITEGATDDIAGHYFFWGDVDEIRDVYKVDKIYQWRTEVVYFEKGKVARKIFSDALKIYKKPKLKKVKKFGDGVPDELAINIACAISQVEPHEYKWHPSYWCALKRGTPMQLPEICNNYYLLSVGGNASIPSEALLYNKLVKKTSYTLGISMLFPLQNKAEFLPERRHN